MKVAPHERHRHAEGAFSAGDFLDVKREIAALAHVAGYREDISDVTGTGEPVRVPGVQTTASFFDVLQVTPLVGRVYSAADEGRGAMAVISEGLVAAPVRAARRTSSEPASA